jgi:hypothetical protein
LIDLYDISEDCRHPQLKSSTPTGILGHESGISPDGRTFYSASHRWNRFRRNFKGRETVFHLALSNANQNYAHRYKNPHVSPDEGYEAAKEDISALMAASQAPAQEALNVAFLKAKAATP